MRVFSSRLILKIALATLVPAAVVAGLGSLWEYREHRRAAERVILHQMREEARQRQRFEDLSRVKSAFIANMFHLLHIARSTA